MRLKIILACLSALFVSSVVPAYTETNHPAYGLDDTVRGLLPSMVLIVALGDKVSLGSGFIISEDGLLVTNDHVVDGSSEIFAVWDSTVGRDFERCRLVYSDTEADIALLTLPGHAYVPMPIADVERAEIGEDIICLGFPLVDSGDFLNNKFSIALTRGKITSIRRNADADIVEVWTDAAITYGNSGGPLYDLNLQGVIGANNLFAPEAEGDFNRAIPFPRVEEAVDLWRSGIKKLPEPELVKTPEMFLEDASEFYGAGETARAIEAIGNALSTWPGEDTSDLRLILADWCIREERYDDAFAIYDGLGDDLPGDEEYVIRYGVLAFYAGRYKRAVELLLPFIVTGDEMVYLTLAAAYAELGQDTEATAYANLALDASESDEVKSLARKVLEKANE